MDGEPTECAYYYECKRRNELRDYWRGTLSEPGFENQEINGMNACGRSPGMNAI